MEKLNATVLSVAPQEKDTYHWNLQPISRMIGMYIGMKFSGFIG